MTSSPEGDVIPNLSLVEAGADLPDGEVSTLPHEGTRFGALPEKLYKIGEVMRHSGLSRQTIHNYTMMGLIEESERTDSGHRLYPADVFHTLEKIDLLKRHRPLREVRAILEAERSGRAIRS